ncbi:hypothetical protein [Agrobacterium pusense]|uniref:hypothetical protein n=1 Tax=Agrobacterium pusense TaxID=648995 RepID=UPI000D1B1D03|nr:hypothetical protein [Agrobacterium pusense]
MLIEAAEYRPDTASLNTAVTDDIRNVLVADGSYIPAPSFSVLTGSIGEPALGGICVRELSGGITVFAGSAGKIYKLNNTDMTWDDVSQAATTYSASSGAPWSFGVFGNFVIAVNQNDDPQVYEIGTDTAFRDLGGSPPRAGIVKIWGDFVALMQLTGNPNRVQWSGLNDCEFWTPGTNNSDYQDFPDGGVVQNSTEATNPIIFLQRAIHRATFVPGSVEIFTFQKIHDKRGAKSPLSVATRGAYAFYADEGGFFQIGTDGSISPIGFEKVDRTVFSRLNVTAISEIQGAVDPFYSRVYWVMDYRGEGTYTEMLVYDWQLGRWSPIDVAITGIMPLATVGYSLEGLDTISTSLEALPFSLDSKAWQGGAPLLAGFNPAGELGVFYGEAMEATITTPEIGDTTGQIMRTTSTYPVTDADSVFVSIGVRMRRHNVEPVFWLPEQEPSYNTGRVRKNTRSRFHRFRIRIPAGEVWNHVKGIDVETQPAGFR